MNTHHRIIEIEETIRILTKELNEISDIISCCPRCKKNMGASTDYRDFSGGRTPMWSCKCDDYNTKWSEHEIRFKRVPILN